MVCSSLYGAGNAAHLNNNKFGSIYNKCARTIRNCDNKDIIIDIDNNNVYTCNDIKPLKDFNYGLGLWLWSDN